MPVPSIGLVRVYPKTIGTNFGGLWRVAANTGNCAADKAPAVSEATIQTYLNSGVDDFATAPKVHTDNAVYCAPTCFGLYPLPTTYGFILSSDSKNIIFNPGGGQQIIDYLSSDFPAGFQVINPKIYYKGVALKTGIGADFSTLQLYYQNQSVRTFTNPNINNTLTNSGDYAILPFGLTKGVLQLITSFGVKGTLAALSDIVTGCGTFASSQSQFDIRQLYLQADYFLWSTQLSFLNDTNKSAEPGSLIQITEAAGKLKEINDLFLYWQDPDSPDPNNPIIVDTTNPVTITRSQFVYATDYEIWFYIPYAVPYRRRRKQIILEADITGTIFSGRATLGILNAQLVDGSGIYTLQSGKTSDTYYDRSVSPVSTLDLKIPDPYARTAYLKR